MTNTEYGQSYNPCRTKIKYESEWDAEMALADMKRKGRDVKTLSAYFCYECGAHHLGNPSEKWEAAKHLQSQLMTAVGIQVKG